VVYLGHVPARAPQIEDLQQAQKDHARFRALTELTADWFWETDAEHRIRWLSGRRADRHLLRPDADLRQALLGDPARRGRGARARGAS
jgi:hypothetical protein